MRCASACAATYEIAAITNDIYTKWDAEYLVRSGALAPERIAGVETGGCPHTAIREDASINLAAVAEMRQKFPDLDLVLIESGGDNLAATFSPELADLTIYVIDVAAGDKIPSKGGPGITRSDLLVINKIDLAPHVGASLEVMERDAEEDARRAAVRVHQSQDRQRRRHRGQFHPGQGRAWSLNASLHTTFGHGKTDQVTVNARDADRRRLDRPRRGGAEHHIEELAAIGVPRAFIRAGVLSQRREQCDADRPARSARARYVGRSRADHRRTRRRAVGAVGSDHTDRKAETMGIALSKQLCGKVLGSTLWRFDESRLIGTDHHPLARDDRRARVLYQEGPFAAIRHPET